MEKSELREIKRAGEGAGGWSGPSQHLARTWPREGTKYIMNK